MHYLFHIPQRTAVLLNVARWALLLISLKDYNEALKIRMKRAIYYVLAVLLVSNVVGGSVHVLSNDHTASFIGGLWARGVIMILPIPCYCVLYIGIKGHYSSIVDKNKSLMSERDIFCVDLALRATRLFFIAIGQYHVIRSTTCMADLFFPEAEVSDALQVAEVVSDSN